jgi:hypothetical protein
MIGMAIYTIMVLKSPKKKEELEGEKTIVLSGISVTEAEVEAVRRAMEEKEAEPEAEGNSELGQES